MSSQAAAPTVTDLSLLRAGPEARSSEPVVPPAAPIASTPEAAPKKKKAPKIFAGLLFAAVVVGGTLYITGRGKEKTDNAQVETHVASIATRVQGQVRKVLVDDNQAVKAGDVLVELDDADYATRVASAKADLAAANANRAQAAAQLALTKKQADANIAIAKGGLSQASALTGSTRAMIDQANADVQAAEAHAVLAKIELDRTEKLVTTGAIPRSELDTKRATNDAAVATVAQARARVVSALSNRENSSGTALAAKGRMLSADTVPEQVAASEAQLALADAKVEQAKATLRQAELNLDYTKIRAESDGIVAKRNVEPGQMVSQERPLMAVVATTAPWVIANFKETQLEHIKPGEKVKIGIDGFDGDDLEGKVVSIQAGTGSRFSLLPPDNASGNFTKVTQRVPVRIEILGAHPELRAGMSAEVTVYTE